MIIFLKDNIMCNRHIFLTAFSIAFVTAEIFAGNGPSSNKSSSTEHVTKGRSTSSSGTTSTTSTNSSSKARSTSNAQTVQQVTILELDRDDSQESLTYKDLGKDSIGSAKIMWLNGHTTNYLPNRLNSAAKLRLKLTQTNRSTILSDTITEVTDAEGNNTFMSYRNSNLCVDMKLCLLEQKTICLRLDKAKGMYNDTFNNDITVDELTSVLPEIPDTLFLTQDVNALYRDRKNNCYQRTGDCSFKALTNFR